MKASVQNLFANLYILTCVFELILLNKVVFSG